MIVSAQGASYDAHTPTEGWDHAVPVLDLILGTALGMTLTVITTSLTLAETVPALADQRDRSRAELARAHEQAAATARRLAAPGRGVDPTACGLARSRWPGAALGPARRLLGSLIGARLAHRRPPP